MSDELTPEAAEHRNAQFTHTEQADGSEPLERPAAPAVRPVFGTDGPEAEVHSQAQADYDAGADERRAQVESFRVQSALARERAAAEVEQAKLSAEDEDTVAAAIHTRRAATTLDFRSP